MFRSSHPWSRENLKNVDTQVSRPGSLWLGLFCALWFLIGGYNWRTAQAAARLNPPEKFLDFTPLNCDNIISSSQKYVLYFEKSR